MICIYKIMKIMLLCLSNLSSLCHGSLTAYLQSCYVMLHVYIFVYTIFPKHWKHTGKLYSVKQILFFGHESEMLKINFLCPNEADPFRIISLNFAKGFQAFCFLLFVCQQNLLKCFKSIFVAIP